MFTVPTTQLTYRHSYIQLLYKICQGSLCRGQVDLAGIEPASESLFIKASPITVAVLTFPWMYAHRQAYNLSSFMIHLPGQSLPGKVSHMVDARFPMCECNGADEQLRLLTLTFRLRLYLVPGWYAVQESADGFPNFKAPVETSTSPQKTSVAGSFPDISGGQTNFLVSFLTGFNYTRMIFRVKDISKKVQTVQFFLPVQSGICIQTLVF